MELKDCRAFENIKEELGKAGLKAKYIDSLKERLCCRRRREEEVGKGRKEE